MNTKMSRDINGNKTVKIIGDRSCPGFSIQTAGNLPITHRDNTPNEGEIHTWVKQYGTLRQKEMLGWY